MFAKANLAAMPGFSGAFGVAQGSNGSVDPYSQLFRANFIGVETGPMISQVRNAVRSVCAGIGILCFGLAHGSKHTYVRVAFVAVCGRRTDKCHSHNPDHVQPTLYSSTRPTWWLSRLYSQCDGWTVPPTDKTCPSPMVAQVLVLLV